MAKDYNQALLDKGYTQEQIDAMTSAVSSGQNAMDVVRNMNSSMGNTQSPAATQNQTSSSSSGGSYVYNPTTGYYEQQTTPSSNRTTPTVQQQTTTTQTQNTGSTVTGTQQQGALKPLSQDYYNQTSDEALSTIKDNLNRYRQTNPEYFTDYDSFKRNFSYDSRNEAQKNELDTWYKGYQQGLELSSVPVSNLYTQYNAGQISAAELENLRISNPEKYAALQTQINRGNIISAYDDTTGTPKMDFKEIGYQMAAQAFSKLTSEDYGATPYFDELEGKMNSPEMLELSDKTTEIDELRDNVISDINSMRKSVEEEYAGTGASRAKIKAIISDRTYDLQVQLQTLDAEYKKYATQYNNRVQQYQNEFQLQIQEYQLNMQARNQYMNDLGFAINLMSYETPEQQQEREWNYWVKQQEYTNGNINSSDYQTRYKAALSSVQNLLSQYSGIPMVRSAEQMAEDILKSMDANGTSLGEELSKINKQIQQKPEYKYLYNNTYGVKTASGITDSYTIGGTEYVVYNGKLMTADAFNKQFGGASGATGTAKQYDLVDSRAMSADRVSVAGGYDGNTLGLFLSEAKNQPGKTGGQCGKFVNDYLSYIGLNTPGGRYYDDELSTKLNSVNTQTPTVGSIAVFDYGYITKSTGKNHGHVGIVTKVYSDGSFDMIDSNGDLKNPGKIRTVHINGSSALQGFFDPSKLPAGSVTTETTGGTLFDQGFTSNYIESEVGLYDAYINNGTTPTDAKLKSLGNGDLNTGWQVWNARVQDYMNQTGAGTLDKKKNDEVNKLRTEMHQSQAYTDYNQMQSYFQKIKNSTNNDTATAASDVSLLFAYMKMLDPKSIVRESEFATAQNMGSLPTKWHAKLKSAVNGKKLTDKQRTEILHEAETLMDGATYLYNNLLDDYAGMITYGGDASRLGKKGTYLTEDYINKYGNPTTTTQLNYSPATTGNTSWVFQFPTIGYSTGGTLGLTNVGGYYTFSNFY